MTCSVLSTAKSSLSAILRGCLWPTWPNELNLKNPKKRMSCLSRLQHLRKGIPVNTRKAPFSSESKNSYLSVGKIFTLNKSFSSEDVFQFGTLTGDTNPIHFDQNAAHAAGFSFPIVHGMLCASLFPTVIASNFVSWLHHLGRKTQTNIRIVYENGSQVLFIFLKVSRSKHL